MLSFVFLNCCLHFSSLQIDLRKKWIFVYQLYIMNDHSMTRFSLYFSSWILICNLTVAVEYNSGETGDYTSLLFPLSAYSLQMLSPELSKKVNNRSVMCKVPVYIIYISPNPIFAVFALCDTVHFLISRLEKFLLRGTSFCEVWHCRRTMAT